MRRHVMFGALVLLIGPVVACSQIEPGGSSERTPAPVPATAESSVPGTTADPPAYYAGRMYSENFEDRLAQDWDMEPGWQVSLVDGRQVLHGEGHSSATFTPGFILWSYAIKFPIKLVSGTVHINYRMRLDNGPTRYVFGFHEGGLYLQKQIGDDLTYIADIKKSHLVDSWHVVEIMGFDGHLQASVDGEIELVVTDDTPLLQGTFAFETLVDSEAMIDEIELLALSKSVTVAMPGPASTQPRASLSE